MRSLMQIIAKKQWQESPFSSDICHLCFSFWGPKWKEQPTYGNNPAKIPTVPTCWHLSGYSMTSATVESCTLDYLYKVGIKSQSLLRRSRYDGSDYHSAPCQRRRSISCRQQHRPNKTDNSLNSKWAQNSSLSKIIYLSKFIPFLSTRCINC